MERASETIHISLENKRALELMLKGDEPINAVVTRVLNQNQSLVSMVKELKWSEPLSVDT